ncbi:hypothetical protein LRK24_09240 [Rhodanobacter denitrificans]|nr:hypothetical protein [Rhodanobacter denitrificans]UJM88320.1 hypothetical protein LRJ86_08570 [Rhodanobacter denitrificans]UJM88663.1 hypothetical protein LRK24_09240 [Rhodanobacter denitrificans]
MKPSWMCVLLAMTTGLSGCIQNSQARPTLPYLQGDTFIVLGVSERVRLSVFKGELDDSSWNCTGLINVANVWSENKFIVLKLKPRVGTEDYGIGQILPDGIGGESFVVTKGVSVPAFHAHPGRVTFVGSIGIFQRDGRFGITRDPSITVDDARAYLSRAYPNLPKDIDVDYLKIVPANGGC